MQKLRTLLRYVAKPNTYPFVVRLIRSKITGTTMDLNATAQEAIDWCKNCAVSTGSALNSLGLKMVSPEQEFPDIYAESRRRVRDCPQAMGGGGNMDLLFSLTRGTNSTSVIETGVAYGWSSLSILLGMRHLQAPRLLSSNLHYPSYAGDERFVGCAVPEPLRENWTLFPFADAQAIPRMLSESQHVDLVHYDSAKSYSARMFAYPLLWNGLKTTGFFVSDDIQDNVAFKHFCRMLNVTPTVIETPQPDGKPTKYVGLIRKMDNRKPRNLLF